MVSTAPIAAIEKLCAKIGWSKDQVDLFEINEAFAVVVMAALKELRLPQDKVNVFGGACAPGHPIGASGARVVVTLLNALKWKSLKRGNCLPVYWRRRGDGYCGRTCPASDFSSSEQRRTPIGVRPFLRGELFDFVQTRCWSYFWFCTCTTGVRMSMPATL